MQLFRCVTLPGRCPSLKPSLLFYKTGRSAPASQEGKGGRSPGTEDGPIRTPSPSSGKQNRPRQGLCGGEEATGGRHGAQAVTTEALEKPHHGYHSLHHPTAISAPACPRAASPINSWPSPPSAPAPGGPASHAGEAGPVSRKGVQQWGGFKGPRSPLWLAAPVPALQAQNPGSTTCDPGQVTSFPGSPGLVDPMELRV